MSTVDLSGLSILVVEDDPLLHRRLTAQLRRLGAEVPVAETLQEAHALIAAKDFDFAFLDVHLPDGMGTSLLEEKKFTPATGVIVMTAHGGVSDAVKAIRLGALDYLVKPFEPGELPLVIERARQARQSARIGEHRRLGQSSDDFYFGPSLAGLEGRLKKIIDSDCRMQGPLPAVLIEGETGTGKTAIARWLHQHGPRSAGEMVEINCAGLPENLAESELFGHERGAFTDARQARMGLFEAAHGSTLFLDEVSSLSAGIQAKVLTAIEDHRIRRIGSTKPISVDVRLIAASNRDLSTLVAQGHFRDDLYQRLDLYRIRLSPLRERGGDILKLAEVFVRLACERQRLPDRNISPTGRERLLRYRWPGNVRELMHEIHRGVVFEEGAELEFPHLPMPGDMAGQSGQDGWLNPCFQFPAQGFSLEGAIDKLVKLAMTQAGENVSAAGRLLGVPRDYIRYRLGRK